jgi:adenosylmethionine-8-amino-7-oxononanoate aminotransferase
MSHILHRQTGHDYPVAVGGQGILVQDANGKEYIDASGGAAVSCLGHSHPDVVAAMVAQLSKLEYAHSSFFTTTVAEDLADDLVAHAPRGRHQGAERQAKLLSAGSRCGGGRGMMLAVRLA